MLIIKFPDMRWEVVCYTWGYILKWLATREREQLLDRLTKLMPHVCSNSEDLRHFGSWVSIYSG